MINYFVSYFYKTTTYQDGFGSMICWCDRPIKTDNDLKKLQQDIIEANKFKRAVILNLTCLGFDEEKESEGDTKC